MKIKSLLSAAILAVVSWQSHATPITLDFTSLPSAQGWTFVRDAGNTEASVFSVDGHVLTMDSRIGNANGYDRSSAINPALPYVIKARSRAFDGGISMSFSFANGSKGGALYLSPNALFTVNSAGHFQLLALIDNSVFHDFQIEGDFISGYTVSVDGSVVGGGQLFNANFTELFFGDQGSAGSGQAQLSAYSFSQSDNLNVPEPGTYTLLFGGLVALVNVTRRETRGLKRGVLKSCIHA
ncbi:MAG: hypothetical protein HWD57_17020 [Candidatus Accumulibacter cognatus]|uniref:PEP-CTERM protein-sorting domain-containing protein n=1 Tax=Candidatus Accumulibacter cognatus TaxID=2954383 RepID=A0A7D5NBE1_9PROT|nr:MAG: hypothetical protein HWD57_17020 [Candidatus Accumulibacter cognatus]